MKKIHIGLHCDNVIYTYGENDEKTFMMEAYTKSHKGLNPVRCVISTEQGLILFIVWARKEAEFIRIEKGMWINPTRIDLFDMEEGPK